MMKRFLTIAMAAVVSTAALAQTQTAKPEAPKSKTMAMVQGTWVFTSTDGQDTTGGPEVSVTITDNKYVQMAAGNVVERGTFKLDETKKPMQLDIMVTEGESAGKTQLGIVEITDTTMKGKLNTAGETVRPTDYALAQGFFVFTATKKK